MKVLTLDIETSPNIAHVWSLWNQNVSLNQLQESGRVMGFGWKWHDRKQIGWVSDHHDGHDEVVSRAFDLLDQADVIVHFNGKRFDIPWLQREILEGGMTPPSPFKQVDLLHVVKKQFRFASNKLAHVTEQLGLTGKLDHQLGHDLWVRCLAGDEKAWAIMRRYCRQDVATTEELYDRLLPWIPSHPHADLYRSDAGEENRCGRCESTDLERRGYAYTALSKFQRYRCRQCSTWSQDKRAIARVAVRPVAS